VNWWKIECPHCGSNTDLLMNDNSIVICRECMEKYEDFEEVDSELEDFDEEDSLFV
jgi:uncharacterized Zn ribbon protein